MSAANTSGEKRGPTMKWLKRVVQCLVAAYATAAFAGTASAQIPPPGYTFAEVTDEDGKPVSGATTVVYNESGEESASSVTDSEGKSILIQNGRQQEHFILRVIKRGFVTYEGRFEPAGGQYVSGSIKIKLTHARGRKRKAVVGKQRDASAFKRAPTPTGPSPPDSRRVRTATSKTTRAPPA